MQKRRLFKGGGRSIIEDLTPINIKRLKSVEQHPEVKNSWIKEGTIHALLHDGKRVKVTERNLKIIDDAAAGSAPVPDIEMTEVVAPPDSVERRSFIVHQWTHDSAGVAASMPKYDRDSRLPHPGAPVGHKNDQAVNGDHRRPLWNRRQNTWECRPRSDKRQPPSWRQTSPHGRAASSGDRRASSPHGQSTSPEDRRQVSSPHGQATFKLYHPRTDARHHHLTAVQRLLGIAGLTVELQLRGTARHLLTAVLRLPGIAGLHHLVTVLHLLEIAGRLTGTAGHFYLTAMLHFPGIA